MPKFLDRPSWYEPNGTQVYGVGVTNGADTYTNGAVPAYRSAAGGFTTIAPTINGFPFTDISAWYAPVTKPSSSFALCYWTPNSRPEWLAMGASGTFLRSNGTGSSPSWVNFSLYRHNVTVKKTSLRTGYQNLEFFVVVYNTDSTPITSISKLPQNPSSQPNPWTSATGTVKNGSVLWQVVGYRYNVGGAYVYIANDSTITSIAIWGSSESSDPSVSDVVNIA